MYSKLLSSPSDAWASFCLCSPFRAFRCARPFLGGHPGCFSHLTAPGAVVGETQVSAAPWTAREVEKLLLSYLRGSPFYRPSGGVGKVPGFVGNPAADTVSNINPSTTLFQKTGVLRGNAPKCVFGDFLHKQKVTPRSVATPLSRQGCRYWHTTLAKGGRTWGHETGPAANVFYQLAHTYRALTAMWVRMGAHRFPHRS